MVRNLLENLDGRILMHIQVGAIATYFLTLCPFYIRNERLWIQIHGSVGFLL